LKTAPLLLQSQPSPPLRLCASPPNSAPETMTWGPKRFRTGSGEKGLATEVTENTEGQDLSYSKNPPEGEAVSSMAKGKFSLCELCALCGYEFSVFIQPRRWQGNRKPTLPIPPSAPLRLCASPPHPDPRWRLQPGWHPIHNGKRARHRRPVYRWHALPLHVSAERVEPAHSIRASAVRSID
jgi:hypothetical protein